MVQFSKVLLDIDKVRIVPQRALYCGPGLDKWVVNMPAVDHYI